MLQESTASGSIQSCEPSGFVGHQTRSEIKIDFRNDDTANIKIECDYSHYVSSIRENFNVNWSVKSDKLCLSNVPENPSTVTNRCSKVVFEKFGYIYDERNPGAIHFVLSGNGLPRETLVQVDRVFQTMTANN